MSEENTAEVIELQQPTQEDAQEVASPSDTPESSSDTKEESKPSDKAEDLDAIESETDTDEDGNEKTVSIKRIKAMAQQAKAYQTQITDLEQQVSNSIPVYDVDIYRQHIGSPNEYDSPEEYEDTVNAYVNQLVASQVQHNIRKSSAISNMMRLGAEVGVDFSKMPSVSEETILLTAESPAAAHIAKMVMGDPKLAEAYQNATPSEVKDFIKQTEGRLQADNERAIQQQQEEAKTIGKQFMDGVDSITGGRLTSEQLSKIQVPSIAAEAMQYMAGGKEIAVYLYNKPDAVKKITEIGQHSPYAALIELGRLESKAMAYTHSNEYKSKYPKSSSFEADKALRGGATAPKGLNVNNDAEFNRRYNKTKNRK